MSSRYDANNFFAMLFAIDMCHQQKHGVTHQTYGLPTILVTFDSILSGPSIAVEEHARRSLKGHTMLVSVAFGF